MKDKAWPETAIPFLYNDPKRKHLRHSLRRNATRTEYYFWSFLCRSQVEGLKFRRQYGVGPFVIDFYCPELRLAVEVDGETHESPEARKYDTQRTKFLQTKNIEAVRFQNGDVLENIDWVLNDLRKCINVRRAQLAVPPRPSYE